jgi:predicted secreted hydrolase
MLHDRSRELRNQMAKGVFCMNGFLFVALSALLGFVSALCAAPWAYAEEFTKAAPGYTWSFPADHGYHKSYETEWWYYTGQLYEESATPFSAVPLYGFQLTFFRKGVRGDGGVQSEYMAHAALTDIAGKKTYFSSRMGGGQLGIAGASADSLGAWSGDWSVDPIGKSLVLRFSVDGQESQPPHALRILVDSLPQPLLQGVGGFSAKAACEGCASLYYSMPRVQLRASYAQGGRQRGLHGIGWMDHEFMTNALGKEQVGWDWMGLMLRDGRSLTLFQLRGDSKKVDFASGSVLREDGVRVLQRDDFNITPLEKWQSPRTKARYPVKWRISVPSEGIDVVVAARVFDAEIGANDKEGKNAPTGEVIYWEGPVSSQDEAVVGYLEMTGYASKVELGG